MSNAYVNVWEEKVVIPTYPIGKPDKNPMFFEKRIYQGSSGVVYPNPVIEKIGDEKEDKVYHGIFIENQFIKVMILPELGGRIQMAYDKLKDRHFIYYNQVIKPALVGLTGPWISGGIEFNWPQHHRPSTFEPIDFHIQENEDGSKTVWVNEIERMFHTKGLTGFTLYPNCAYIEIQAKLLNTSNLPQTFLWWANPAVKVNDHYQSVFPPDVNAVFDHGKRDVSTFPIATGTYYKVDYSPGTDISMYKNIPVPTSYMAINSIYDFVGGYEHDSRGGLLHVANHHVSPGKKQWTWGHSDFGKAWDRNLTDEDGPYIELMTGMFTDNQPDFTWILPNEEKSFKQYFMPYSELGVIKNASKDILLAVNKVSNKLILKIYVTSLQPDLRVSLYFQQRILLEDRASIEPGTVYIREIEVDEDVIENELLLIVASANGKELIRYDPFANPSNPVPEAAKSPLSAKDTENVEQLFLTGQHLEQYRHATYSPVPYYEEGLLRDPKDIRCNNALGLWYLRRGQFQKSEAYFRRAIETNSQRNPNPYDTEPFYNLGLSLKYQQKPTDAYKNFYKATWGRAHKDSGFLNVARIDLSKGDLDQAIAHLNLAIDNNANLGKAYVLKSAAQRHLNLPRKAIQTANISLERDPFNLGSLYELVLTYKMIGLQEESDESLKQLSTLSRGASHNFIAYAIDYADAGQFEEAIGMLEHCMMLNVLTGLSPLIYYYLGYFCFSSDKPDLAVDYFSKAAAADSYLCFPNRLEDINVLKSAISVNPNDSNAAYYLGNLFYDKRQYEEAIKFWELAVQLNDSFPTAFRNLGIAYFNKRNDWEKALEFFEKAYTLDTADARVLMELDQLYKRIGKAPEQRRLFLSANMATALLRDDVYLEYVTLLNLGSEFEQALEWLMNRQFHPWEGGEGKASGQYVYSLTELAKLAIARGAYDPAIDLLERAQSYPHNLGEGKLYGTQENDVFYWLGCAFRGLGDEESAVRHFRQATIGLEEPSAAFFYNDQQPDKIFYQGLANAALGKLEKAQHIFNNLIDYGRKHLADDITIDYFAVSLPNLLVFEDDLQVRNEAHCYFMIGLGHLGLKDSVEAKKALTQVLSIDPAHQGAKTHINMPN